MKPYYEDTAAGITIYHGDCREVLPTLRPGSVDWILADPPFYMPINASVSTGHSTRVWPKGLGDMSIMHAYFSDVFGLCRSLIADDGGFYTFCDTISHAVYVGILYPLFSHLQTIVWDKERGGLGVGWRHSHEFILHGRNRTTAHADGFRRDVLRVKTTPSRQRLHPSEKPPALLSVLLDSMPPGAVVLDPFAGGGVLGVVARSMGRRAILVEIEERYCEIAAKRLQQSVMRLEVPA